MAASSCPVLRPICQPSACLWIPSVRAFLSSTFSDFQEERDLLVKQVFLALRQRAKGRGVELVDVDLRWVITEHLTQQVPLFAWTVAVY